jgi:putative membrane protein
MVELIVRILINALALFVAVKVLPSNLLSFNWGDEWWKLLLVALVFALVNSYIKPIVKALSMPIGLLTLGLVAFVINAAMLLLTAWISGQIKLGFKLGTFPPTLNSARCSPRSSSASCRRSRASPSARGGCCSGGDPGRAP